MTTFLAPVFVSVLFTEKSVVVAGEMKTCQGIPAKDEKKARIICNSKEFKTLTDSQRYRLIHHEYAGLALVEKNEGHASDYYFSNQITNMLQVRMVSRLGIKRESWIPRWVSGVSRTNELKGTLKNQTKMETKDLVVTLDWSCSVDMWGRKKILHSGKVSSRISRGGNYLLPSKRIRYCYNIFQYSENISLLGKNGVVLAKNIKLMNRAGLQVINLANKFIELKDFHFIDDFQARIKFYQIHRIGTWRKATNQSLFLDQIYKVTGNDFDVKKEIVVIPLDHLDEPMNIRAQVEIQTSQYPHLTVINSDEYRMEQEENQIDFNFKQTNLRRMK
jgi:hypothetical protein